MEHNITEATSIFQIGGVAGHLFCLKSLQAKYEKYKKLLILCTHKVFVDCMSELYSANVEACAYRLFFLLHPRAERLRLHGLGIWRKPKSILCVGYVIL